MYTYLKPLAVREQLLSHQLRVFTPLAFTRLFGATPTQTKYFLEEQARNGLLVRLKRGLYALQTEPLAEQEIANALYQPSYLSFEYALAFYNILPEMPHLITSATTKPTRLFSVAGREYAYHTLKPAAYTGYTRHILSGRPVLMAEPEKAVADYLYYVSLGKKPRNDRLITGSLNREKVQHFAARFGRPQIVALADALFL